MDSGDSDSFESHVIPDEVEHLSVEGELEPGHELVPNTEPSPSDGQAQEPRHRREAAIRFGRRLDSWIKGGAI